ncbi:transposase [Candidatus Enterovibrio escicola]|uniref:Transposase DDE domain-containing protein n=1 Tax=Candidatus Enterovibrio escicola TaxID=1927127 RepID=A0A2A5T097_9GAMM|nr:hypothetical protein BTN49_2834 [Candidatus Enterovibrio escacola]
MALSKASGSSWPWVYILDTEIETVLMVKGISKLPLRGLKGFLNLVFTLMNVPLKYPTYTCISNVL